MGFIVDGLLVVTKRADNGKNIVLARLTKDCSIGEMALIDKPSRSASVIAQQSTTLGTLTEKGLDLFAVEQPMWVSSS